METNHVIHLADARKLRTIENESIDLVITSPMYPMIEMWDEVFASQNENIAEALQQKEGARAFELMHQELDKVWTQLYRVMKDNRIACINIGDAVRTLNGEFRIYPNYARILHACMLEGFEVLPSILWVKPTNKPNKFMGSGMLPNGAYVTLEHEHIIILRKGGKRNYSRKETNLRRESAYFWEERNNWFSDIWRVNGTTQNIKKVERRTAAYPFEIPYRLINMYSLKGETVLDPFLGTGTTTLAAIAAKRNSHGVEIAEEFIPVIEKELLKAPLKEINKYIENRIIKHKQFAKEQAKKGKPLKHDNEIHNIKVKTRMERFLKLQKLQSIEKREDKSFRVNYTQ